MQSVKASIVKLLQINRVDLRSLWLSEEDIVVIAGH